MPGQELPGLRLDDGDDVHGLDELLILRCTAENLLASAYGGTVTRKFAKTDLDALYGKPGNPADPDALVPGL